MAVGTPADLSRSVKAGETVEVPLWASFLTGRKVGGDALVLQGAPPGVGHAGPKADDAAARAGPCPIVPGCPRRSRRCRCRCRRSRGWPSSSVELTDRAGVVLHRNFTTFVVEGARPDEVTLADGRRARVARIDPKAFSSARWSLKQWNVLDGLKVNGAGSGHFEYRVPWPAGLKLSDVAAAAFLVEASAKQLNGKDRDDAAEMQGDYMRGLGTLDPSRNPNAYPMTDTVRFPSAVTVRVNGVLAGRHELPDDPADHRGILSWHAQLKDRKLREAGSYGYLLEVEVPRAALERAAASGTLEIRLEVDPALPGGLALYGARFGRYPVDPTVVFVRNE